MTQGKLCTSEWAWFSSYAYRRGRGWSYLTRINNGAVARHEPTGAAVARVPRERVSVHPDAWATVRMREWKQCLIVCASAAAAVAVRQRVRAACRRIELRAYVIIVIVVPGLEWYLYVAACGHMVTVDGGGNRSQAKTLVEVAAASCAETVREGPHPQQTYQINTTCRLC